MVAASRPVFMFKDNWVQFFFKRIGGYSKIITGAICVIVIIYKYRAKNQELVIRKVSNNPICFYNYLQSCFKSFAFARYLRFNDFHKESRGLNQMFGHLDVPAALPSSEKRDPGKGARQRKPPERIP